MKSASNNDVRNIIEDFFSMEKFRAIYRNLVTFSVLPTVQAHKVFEAKNAIRKTIDWKDYENVNSSEGKIEMIEMQRNDYTVIFTVFVLKDDNGQQPEDWPEKDKRGIY